MGKEAQSTFGIQTDIPWEDFKSWCHAKFDDPSVKLGYKMTGDLAHPPPFQLICKQDFDEAMTKAIALCTRTRTREIEMTVYDTVRIGSSP